MSSRRAFRPHQVLLVAATVAALCTPVSPANAAPWASDRKNFASPRIEEVWRNADLAVQQGSTSRSWTWGPGPWFDYQEVYKQSPNGLRQVQYFATMRSKLCFLLIPPLPEWTLRPRSEDPRTAGLRQGKSGRSHVDQP